MSITGQTKGRKRAVTAQAHVVTARGELGYAPLDVFDLWQRHLHRVTAWLKANPEQASDVMEATVRLLAGNKDAAGPRLHTRQWQSMHGTGCVGRYTPSAAPSSPSSKPERAGWGTEAEAEANAAAASGGYVAWLRVKVSTLQSLRMASGLMASDGLSARERR